MLKLNQIYFVSKQLTSEDPVFIVNGLQSAEKPVFHKNCPQCANTHYVWALDFTSNMVVDKDSSNNTAFDKMMVIFRELYWVANFITVYRYRGIDKNTANQSEIDS